MQSPRASGIAGPLLHIIYIGVHAARRQRYGAGAGAAARAMHARQHGVHRRCHGGQTAACRAARRHTAPIPSRTNPPVSGRSAQRASERAALDSSALRQHTQSGRSRRCPDASARPRPLPKLRLHQSCDRARRICARWIIYPPLTYLSLALPAVRLPCAGGLTFAIPCLSRSRNALSNAQPIPFGIAAAGFIHVQARSMGIIVLRAFDRFMSAHSPRCGRYSSGDTLLPSTSTSKCRCGFISDSLMALAPTAPIASPAFTRWPSLTSSSDSRLA